MDYIYFLAGRVRPGGGGFDFFARGAVGGLKQI